MKPIPTDAVYDRTDLGTVAVSPDGQRVAYVATERDPVAETTRRSVFVVPTDGSADPHRLTRADDAGTLAWSADGDRLGVLLAREPDTELRVERDVPDEEDDEDGTLPGEDDDPSQQLWVYDLARGGDPRQVTSREHGVRAFDWGPNGERVVVSARDPTDDEQVYLDRREDGGPIETERLQHKYDGAGWLDTVETYLFVLDIETREHERLDEAVGGGIFEAQSGLEPAWHPSEDRIAFCAYHGEDADDTYARDLYVVDVATGERQRLTDGDVTAQAPTWSPDGERLATVQRDPENWYRPSEVAVVDPSTGESQSLSAAVDRTLSWHGAPVWLDSGTLLAGIGDEARTRLLRCHHEDGPERVGEWQAEGESATHVDADGGTVVCGFARPDDGADLYGFDAANLDATDDPRTRLTDHNHDLLSANEWPSCHRLDFESDDGTAVEGLLYGPADFDPAGDTETRPLVLRIHGGPMSYDEPEFDTATAAFVSRGYLVLQVNYRGSTSYGRAFCETLRGAWNTVEVEDLLSGVEAAVERGWADPDRLFVTGFSQGGINTAYLLVESDRFAAGAAEHGIYDARAAFGTDDSHRWWELDFGLPWENPDAYDAISTVTDADSIDTPLLLTAGENDWRCPPTQAEQLHVSLRKRGVDSRLVVYPEENHNVGQPEREIHRLDALLSWFERHDPATDG